MFCYPLPSKLSPGHAAHSNNIYVSRGEDIKKIKESNTNGRWWIKADACDLRKGLRESMRHEWAGDSDLGDGKLQALYQDYMARRTFYSGLGLKDRRVRVKKDLVLVISALDVDFNFLKSEEKAAKDKYAAKQRQTNASEDSMFALARECECFQTLINKELKSSFSSLHSRMSVSQTSGSTASDLTSLHERLLRYAQDLFFKKREAASHLKVFMIADEKRDMKRYAVPVRFIPYHSVTDQKVLELCQELRSVMVDLGMVVVGEFTYYNNNRVICNTCMYVPLCALYLYDKERLTVVSLLL